MPRVVKLEYDYFPWQPLCCQVIPDDGAMARKTSPRKQPSMLDMIPPDRLPCCRASDAAIESVVSLSQEPLEQTRLRARSDDGR